MYKAESEFAAAEGVEGKVAASLDTWPECHSITLVLEEQKSLERSVIPYVQLPLVKALTSQSKPQSPRCFNYFILQIHLTTSAISTIPNTVSATKVNPCNRAHFCFLGGGVVLNNF